MTNKQLSNIHLSLQELTRGLVNHPESLRREIRYVRSGGVDIPVRILDIPAEGAGSNAPLIVTFHGGVSGDIPYPYFYGHRFIAQENTEPRTVLALCDPTLGVPGGLRFGWYAGYNGIDLPLSIHNLLETIVSCTKPSRLILTGGSTGAHAALRHVGSFPGAICLGLNPLPRISNYWRPGVEAFYKSCWPGQYDPDTLTCPHVIDDAGDIYAEAEFENTFLFVQNPTDHHVTHQAAPLLEKLGRNPNMRSKVMAIMPFWADAIGHSAPKGVFESWVEAAITSTTTDPRAISLNHDKLDRLDASKSHRTNIEVIKTDQLLAREISNQARMKCN